MNLHDVMTGLESLGNERTKKQYLSRGAKEPLFGVATGAMNPLFKKVKINQPLAEELYATGNYDAMYFAGMIADPRVMTEADFDRWMQGAYFPMLSDYVVAVTLAESDLAMNVANRWIKSGDELYVSAGYACYQWLLGWRPDSYFEADKLRVILDEAVASIESQTGHMRKVINDFIAAVGVSFMPLHDEAVAAAAGLNKYQAENPNTCAPFAASLVIQKAKNQGRLGFKRRAVRC